MDIAKAKRRENIAEYILYLWQLEDLLRALQFSPEAIFSTLVAPRRDIAEEQKHVFLLWYLDLANLLRQEGKEEKGHLEHTLHLIRDLHDLHLQLLKLPAGEHYRRTYAAAARRAGQSRHQRHGTLLPGPLRGDALPHQGRGRQIGRQRYDRVHLPRRR